MIKRRCRSATYTSERARLLSVHPLTLIPMSSLESESSDDTANNMGCFSVGIEWVLTRKIIIGKMNAHFIDGHLVNTKRCLGYFYSVALYLMLISVGIWIGVMYVSWYLCCFKAIK